MNKISALILDDEQDSLDLLSLMIRRNCPQIAELYTCCRPAQALKEIPLLRPDLLFIDVQMPGMDGFEVLQQLQPLTFSVIFVTAFNQYAIKALRFNALDYLLKPVDAAELKEAVNRSADKSSRPADTQLQASVKIAAGAMPDKIAVTAAQGIVFISLEEILMVEASNNYARLVLTDGRSFLLSKPLREAQVILEESHFLRIHRQYLINTRLVRHYNRHEGVLTMSNGAELPVARAVKERLMALYRQL